MDNTGPERTVLFSSDETLQGTKALTDIASAPRFENLNDRMVYAAHSQPKHSFNVSLNALVSASAKLLSHVIALKTEVAAQDLAKLNANLCECIRSFDVAALEKGADVSQIQAARYVLCTVVDEAVVTTAWGNKSEWSKMSLLSHFHNETFGGEKFFSLLDRVVRSPEKYISLLELMYICLSLGFEGKYRIKPRGSVELEAIRDSVYRLIVRCRGEIPRELSPRWEGMDNGRRRLVRIVPWWLVIIFVLISLAGMYSGFAWVLGEQREAALQPFQTIVPALTSSQL